MALNSTRTSGHHASLVLITFVFFIAKYVQTEDIYMTCMCESIHISIPLSQTRNPQFGFLSETISNSILTLNKRDLTRVHRHTLYSFGKQTGLLVYFPYCMLLNNTLRNIRLTCVQFDACFFVFSKLSLDLISIPNNSFMSNVACFHIIFMHLSED